MLTLTRQMSPVLKWAGGKSQILDHIIDKIPKKYNRYFEPFLGAGSVLFALKPEVAFVNDINSQLINLYGQIKNNATTLIEIVKELDNVECNSEFYYYKRDKFNEKIKLKIFDTECAALMIWINKHCFNGLYRVNSKGLFNVPFNNRTKGKSIDEENIISISEYLNNFDIDFSCEDFEKVCDDVGCGDFVYFDSPYIPESETAYFTEYTKDSFSYEDHKRLSMLFKELDKKGAKLMLSNNDVPLVYDLYKNFNIESLDVKRMINSNAQKRMGREVLITNY